MITSALFMALLAGSQSPNESLELTYQVRPGTFGRASFDPQKAARAQAIDKARMDASELLGQGQAREALQVLMPWRGIVGTDDDLFLAGKFFKAYVILGEWRMALRVAQDEYDGLHASRSRSAQSHHVLRLATALYVVGQKEQSWQLCQQHTDLFNENFYDSYLPEFKDKPITRVGLGSALLRASAKREGSDLRQYFYGLLVRDRPNDAEAHFLLAEALPHMDLLSRLYHYRKAQEFGDAEMQKKAGKQADIIAHDLKMKEKQERRGGGATGFNLGGGLLSP